MNLGKQVPLEVHGGLGNAKITKKYFPILEWGVIYIVGKLKKRASNKQKNTPIRFLVKKIRPQEVLGLKIGNSRECPGATPNLRGGVVLQRAAEAYVWKVGSFTPARPL